MFWMALRDLPENGQACSRIPCTVELVGLERTRFRPRPFRSFHTAHQLIGVVVYGFFAHMIGVTKYFSPSFPVTFQGKYEEAETLYVRSLAIDEKAYGPDHPKVAIGLNNRAGFSRSQVSHIIFLHFGAMFVCRS